MNREIKFKVWDTQLKLWVNNLGMKKNNVLVTPFEERYHVLQYSEINDRENIEIYDRSFIQLGAEKDIYQVRFHAGCFLCYHGNKQIGLLGELKMCFVKVVGNIYDNPELT